VALYNDFSFVAPEIKHNIEQRLSITGSPNGSMSSKHYDKASLYLDCVGYNIVQNQPISPPTHPND